MHWGKPKKQDKRKIVDKLRRYLNGDDLIEEIMPLSNGLAVLSLDELNKLRTLKAYKDKYGLEPIEGFEIVHDGVTITYIEAAAIAAKVKGAVAVIPDNGRGTPNPIEYMNNNGVILWAEERTYPDPEIPGIRYNNPANVPSTLRRVDLNEISDSSDVSGHSDKIKTDARNEPVMSSQALQARQVVDRSKQYLKDKLDEFAKQEKVDLAFRDKALLWKKWQSSSPYLD